MNFVSKYFHELRKKEKKTPVNSYLFQYMERKKTISGLEKYPQPRKCILLIEDNNDIRENTAEIIELRGYQVISAEDGNDGIEKASAYLPGLILCDIQMPLKSGYEVFISVRSNPVTSNIPFVFFTASAEKKEIKKAMDAGANGYLVKPVDSNQLFEEIKLWVA